MFLNYFDILALKMNFYKNILKIMLSQDHTSLNLSDQI